MIELKAVQLRKQYTHRRLFSELSFEHRSGVLGIAGANGSVKSTLLRCIAFLQGIGALQQQQEQAGLEAQRLNTLAQQAEPFERLDFGAGILGNLPYPSQSITSSPYQYSPYSQSLGLGIGALSAFG